MTMPATSIVAAPSDKLSASPPKSQNKASSNDPQAFDFLGLPVEAQQNVFRHLPRKTLQASQLVSKQCHELASAALYFHLAFYLTTSDVSPHGSAKFGLRLPAALETIASSQYDYARHVRSFTVKLSELDLPEIQQRTLIRYADGEHTLSYLNTLLLLFLRRACGLEIFAWKVPISLSQAVCNALASIRTLATLQLRCSSDFTTVNVRTNINVGFQNAPTLPTIIPVPPNAQPLAITSSLPQSATLSSPAQSLPLSAGPSSIPPNPLHSRSDLFKIPFAIAKMQNLRQFALLGVDKLAMFDEAASCIQASATTLKVLALSMAPEMARRAHRPSASAPVPHAADQIFADDEEDDDDITQGDSPPLSAAATAPQVNEADMRKEFAIHQSLMAKMLGLQPAASEDKAIDKDLAKAALKAASPPKRTDVLFTGMERAVERMYASREAGSEAFKREFVAFLTTLYKIFDNAGDDFERELERMFASQDPNFMVKESSSPASNPSTSGPATNAADDVNLPQLEGLNLSSTTTGPDASSTLTTHPSAVLGQENPQGSGPADSSANTQTAHALLTAAAGPQGSTAKESTDAMAQNSAGLSAFPASVGNKTPAVKTSDKKLALVLPGPSTPENKKPKAKSPVPSKQLDGAEGVDDMGIDIAHPDATDEEEETGANDSEEQTEASDAPGPSSQYGSTLSQLQASQPSEKANGILEMRPGFLGPDGQAHKTSKPLDVNERIRQYIRQEHGYSLSQLELFAVPLKPSVLVQMFNLPALRKLTLLSIGPQGAIWSLLEKHHVEHTPLNLRNIYTDDVSMAFLSCLSKLKGVEQLCLIRRSSKSPDCTTMKTSASLHDIRIHVLRRHAKSLQVLSIDNLEDESWHLDSKCLRLLAAKATRLQQLAFSVDVNDFHTFLQCLPRMRALRAINVVDLRSPDRMTPSAMRECRRFLLDVHQYYPRLGLRYAAFGGIVFEIGEYRKFKAHKKHARQSVGASKSNSPTKESPTKPEPLNIPSTSGDAVADSSESLSDIENASQRAVFIRHLKFWDLPNIYIYTNVVRHGRF